MIAERTSVHSRLSDEEALLVRLAESIGRSGLDASSTLELIASWLESEFSAEDFSDTAASRFRTKLSDHGVDVDKLAVVIADPARFPHRSERVGKRVVETAEQMAWVRQTVGRLLAGETQDRGTNRHTSSAGNTGTKRDNSAPAVLRRLNRDRPDLAAKVAAREISHNAAAIEAGYRRRKISVPVADPFAAARSLRKHMDKAHLAELARLLSEVDDP